MHPPQPPLRRPPAPQGRLVRGAARGAAVGAVGGAVAGDAGKGAAVGAGTGALHGSSHYDLPPVLRWFTANIGIHHVHHLCSRIPCYRLGEALREHPELRAVSRLTLKESFRCLRLAQWDEDRRRLVAFRNARASRGPDPRSDRSALRHRPRSGRRLPLSQIAGTSLMQISGADRRLC